MMLRGNAVLAVFFTGSNLSRLIADGAWSSVKQFARPLCRHNYSTAMAMAKSHFLLLAGKRSQCLIASSPETHCQQLVSNPRINFEKGNVAT